MDSDTPIDCYQLQFTQREAADLSEADMATINNWIQRKDFTLQEVTDRHLIGRRMFSVADIGALHTMLYCVKMLDMRPTAAGVAGRVVHAAFGDGRVFDKQFKFWHILKKAWPFVDEYADGDEAATGWHTQGVWQDRKSGAFYHYDPHLFGTDEPFGFPHFPCVSIPTTDIVSRIFLACADHLVEEAAVQPEAPESAD